MKFASKAAASAVIFTPRPAALLLIQVSSAAPLGRVHCITLPCSTAILSRGLLEVSSSSTSTISTVVSGRRGMYSTRPFSKPARDSERFLLPFLLFFALPLLAGVFFDSAVTEEASSPRRRFV